MITSEYPSFITIIRVYDKFCVAVMEWDHIQERYDARGYRGKKRKSMTDAKIDAESLAQKLDMEIRWTNE